MWVFRCVLLLLLVNLNNCVTNMSENVLQQNENDKTTIVSSFFFNPIEQPKAKYFLRKCCPPGQIYLFSSSTPQITKLNCRNHSSMEQQSSVLIEMARELFPPTSENDSTNFDQSKFDINFGFPNCTKMWGLSPKASTSDNFYPLPNGTLVAPYRFFTYPSGYHCVEDMLKDESFRKVAFVCRDKAQDFPKAIDAKNRLQLNFLNYVQNTTLASLPGLPVISKWCNIGKVLWGGNETCVPKNDYATPSFEEFLTKYGEKVFIRTGKPRCLDRKPSYFYEWTIDENIRVQWNIGEAWDNRIYSSEDYRVEDVVTVLRDLPRTDNIAFVCRAYPEANQKNSTTVSTERTSSTDKTEINEKTFLPKCCPEGFIVQAGTCQKYTGTSPLSQLKTNILQQAKLFMTHPENVELESPLRENDAVGCGFLTSEPLKKSFFTNAFLEPNFHTNRLREMKLFIRYKNGSKELQVSRYCVDIKIVPSPPNRFYDEHVFYCIKSDSTSTHYPVLLYISVVGLLLTFTLYFLTPAKEMILKKRRDKLRVAEPQTKARQSTLASLTTGSNLLCHVSSLCLAFICWALGQQDVSKPGQAGCIALGYVAYAATIASYTWLMIYFFHYVFMIRISFVMKNNIAFLLYSILGWGVSTVAVLGAAVAQLFPESNLVLKYLNPSFGLERCWFGSNASLLALYYIPISLLLSLSSVFMMTLLLPWHEKNAGDLRIGSNQTEGSADKAQRKETLRAVILLLFTGIPWILEIAAWLLLYFGEVSRNQEESLLRLLKTGNAFNNLRGVLIFIVFVLFQNEVRVQLLTCLTKLICKVASLHRKEMKGDNGEQTSKSPSTQQNASSNEFPSSSSTLNSSSHQSRGIREQPTRKLQPSWSEADEVTAF